jgi:lipopolysaccharide/colanic/teichoic acid biosynthesis glycosyltransferase
MIRILDIIFSFIGIIILMPLFIVVYICIISESKGGGFYKQKRVGRNSRLFNLYKFRSMCQDADKGSLITVGSRDPRMTHIGVFIRKYKIDELPQLFNVLKGDMSLVGPRPEVPLYVDLYTPEQKRVLEIRPGITDYASIAYADENMLLGKTDDPERMYVEVIMPDKIRLNMKYVENQSIKEYFKIVFMTFSKILKSAN